MSDQCKVEASLQDMPQGRAGEGALPSLAIVLEPLASCCATEASFQRLLASVRDSQGFGQKSNHIS